jgi:tetrapyrrole methylase family protein/MazG family protein
MTQQARVVVVGLGPGGAGQLTESTRSAMFGASKRFLRTARHPGAAELAGFTSFDSLYEESETFAEVYEKIVEVLVSAAIDLAGVGTVLYAVPGSPSVAEQSVSLLLDDPRVEVTVLPALSFLDLAWARLRIDPLERSVRLIDGMAFATEAAGERGPLLVAQCFSQEVLSAIKLSIDEGPGLETLVTVLHHLGLDDEAVFEVPWEDLDRAFIPDHLTSLWIPQLASPVAGELQALEQLVLTLRERCPWDAKQTHGSLAGHLLEESYEVIDAINELDLAESAASPERIEEAAAHLCEELGDLLFQVYFHARLGTEEGRFNLADIARGIHEKLVHRHPHVFGDLEVHDPETVVANWEVIKQSEKRRDSVTDGIPLALPALALATKLQRKAAAVGLDGEPMGEDDDFVELLSAPGEGAAPPDAARQVGAALYRLAELAARRGIDPEQALRAVALSVRDRIVAHEREQLPPT